jgi:hypothetical protein
MVDFVTGLNYVHTNKYGLLDRNAVYFEGNVSEKHIASIFRIEELAKISLPPTSGSLLLGLVFDLKKCYVSPKRRINIMEMQLFINFYVYTFLPKRHQSNTLQISHYGT